MGMMHITSFCCCLGLEAGSKFIGFLHLLVSLTLMVVCGVIAESARGNVGTVEDAEDHLYSTVYKYAIIFVAFTVVHVLLAMLLLYSVYTRNSQCLRVWVFAMLTLTAASLGYLVYSMTFGFSTTGSDIFLAFLEGIVFFGVVLYCVLCVYSYSLLLRSCEDMEGPKDY